jgi:hypothetical protein
VSRKQPNIIESIIRSSDNPNSIILNAFKKVPEHNLCRFIQVALEHYKFKDSFIKEIETRQIQDVKDFSPPSFLKEVDDTKVFYLCLGLLLRNLEKIQEFIIYEKELNTSIFSSENDKSHNILDSINNQFGLSFWGERTRISLFALKNSAKKYKSPIKNNNSTASILINYFLNSSSDFFSELDLCSDFANDFKKIENSNENSNSDAYEFIKYMYTGENPRINVNIYHILKLMINGTLIDLYKAFELLCIRNIYKDCEADIKKLSINFLKKIKHETFSLYEKDRIILSDHVNELNIIDHYSECKYLDVVNTCNQGRINDIGLLIIYSKSLSYLGDLVN